MHKANDITKIGSISPWDNYQQISLESILVNIPDFPLWDSKGYFHSKKLTIPFIQQMIDRVTA